MALGTTAGRMTGGWRGEGRGHHDPTHRRAPADRVVEDPVPGAQPTLEGQARLGEVHAQMTRRAPYVAVQTDIRKEERVAVLGDVGGYSEYEALGRIVTLWAWCADRKLENAPEDSDGYAVSEAVIRRFLGPNGVEAILGGGCDDFALGVLRPDGLIYLRGTSETVKNLRAHAKGAAAGGESRHAKGERLNGRFVAQTTIVQPAHQPATSTPPAPLQLDGTVSPASSSVDPTSHILQPTTDPEIPLPRAIPPSSVPSTELGTVPSTGHTPALGSSVVTSELELRQGARLMLWREFGALRSAIAAELGVEARPLPAVGDPGERALAMRFVEAGAAGVPGVVADARHAMAVVAAEARRDKSVQWLTGALFEERSWRRAIGMTVEDAARERAPPARGGGSPVRPEQPRKTTLL